MDSDSELSLGRERELFLAALEKRGPSERAAFLNDACASDTKLRSRIESLLRHHAEDTFLKPLTSIQRGVAITVRVGNSSELKPGDWTGRYKLLEQIGEGGCGIVYVAEQEHPVRRRVALKVIKLGMDTRQVIARFEAERQALALMDHPNIAKVLDAGATENGRPYFVMELVKGIPITRYCDEQKLKTQARLNLFIQVCHAVQHAHQKGIIHRDIKPSNILVADHDGVPVPKVIDFGIAKATTDQRLTDKTLYTAIEQFIGTPAYMSPEQANLSGLDVDTRCDIYSLGVLLYELLTGFTPFDAKDLIKSGLDAIRYTIREVEPPRPSTRLSTLQVDSLVATAKQHGTESVTLLKLIRGDLDWIVMKCLEKDRTRRYETANGLAMDVQRHLHNEPVTACPPGNLYRFEKMVRRNKGAFIAASAVVASLLIGLGFSTYLYIREKRARNELLATQGKMAELGRNVDLLRAQTEDVRKTADERADRLRDTVTLLNLDSTNLEQAEFYYRQTLQLQREINSNNMPDVVKTLLGLGQVLREEEKLPEAEKTQREAVAMERKLTKPDSVKLAVSLANLGLMLQQDDKSAEAEPVFRESLALFRRLATIGVAGQYHSLGVVLHHLAMVLQMQKKLPEARSLAEEAAELYWRHPDWPSNESQHALQVLGDILKDLDSSDFGVLTRFELLYRERLAEVQKNWPADPLVWQNSLDELLTVLRAERKGSEVDRVIDDLVPRSGATKPYRSNQME